MEPTIEVHDEGDTETLSAEEYADAGGRLTTAQRLAEKQGQLADGTLEDEVQSQPQVVERARDEGAFVASIKVPFWFRQDDDEVYETFGDDDRIIALVEDYSEDAWRIIGSQEMGLPGDIWFTWEWTFVPKSLATVTRVAGVENKEQGCEFRSELFELERDQRDEWGWDDGDDEDDDNDNGRADGGDKVEAI